MVDVKVTPSSSTSAQVDDPNYPNVEVKRATGVTISVTSDQTTGVLVPSAIDQPTLVSAGIPLETISGVVTGNSIIFTRTGGSTYSVDLDDFANRVIDGTAEIVTSTITGNTMVFTKSNGNEVSVDLDDFANRIVDNIPATPANTSTTSAQMSGNTILFTRDDASTYSVDLDDTFNRILDASGLVATNTSTTTAAISGNTMLFTRDDASTFSVDMDDFANRIIDVNAELIAALPANPANTSTATAAVSGNTILFTREDATTYSVDLDDIANRIIDGVGIIPSNTSTSTAQISGNTMLFTRDDASTFSVDLDDFANRIVDVNAALIAALPANPANTSTTTAAMSGNTMLFTRDDASTFSVDLDDFANRIVDSVPDPANTSTATAAMSGNTILFTRDDASTYSVDLDNTFNRILDASGLATTNTSLASVGFTANATFEGAIYPSTNTQFYQPYSYDIDGHQIFPNDPLPDPRDGGHTAIEAELIFEFTRDDGSTFNIDIEPQFRDYANKIIWQAYSFSHFEAIQGAIMGGPIYYYNYLDHDTMTYSELVSVGHANTMVFPRGRYANGQSAPPLTVDMDPLIHNILDNAESQAASIFLRKDDDDTTSGSLTVEENLRVHGDLIVSGNTVSIDATELFVNDKVVVFNANVAGQSYDVGMNDDQGFYFRRYEQPNTAAADVVLYWDERSDIFMFAHSTSGPPGVEQAIELNGEYADIQARNFTGANATFSGTKYVDGVYANSAITVQVNTYSMSANTLVLTYHDNQDNQNHIGPVLELYREANTSSDGDTLGAVAFTGEQDFGSTKFEAARIESRISSLSGADKGHGDLLFYTGKSAVSDLRMRIDNDESIKMYETLELRSQPGTGHSFGGAVQIWAPQEDGSLTFRYEVADAQGANNYTYRWTGHDALANGQVLYIDGGGTADTRLAWANVDTLISQNFIDEVVALAGAGGIANTSTATAAMSGNTMLFTRQDASSYSVDLDDFANRIVPANTSTLTAQMSGNTMLFTRNDFSQFSVDMDNFANRILDAVPDNPANTSTATAQMSGNTILFTREDASTFSVDMDDTFNIIIDAAVLASGNTGSGGDGNPTITAAMSGNTMLFTRQDASSYSVDLDDFANRILDAVPITPANTSTSTAAMSGNTMLFTRDDASTFSVDMDNFANRVLDAVPANPANTSTSTAQMSGNTMLFTRDDASTFSVDLDNFANRIIDVNAALIPTLPANTSTSTAAMSGNTMLFTRDDASNFSVDLDDFANRILDVAGGEITVQDEGVALSTAASTLDFVGAGVTASGTGATKTITIPGGGSGTTVANGHISGNTLILINADDTSVNIDLDDFANRIVDIEATPTTVIHGAKTFVYTGDGSNTAFSGADNNGEILQVGSVGSFSVFVNGAKQFSNNDFISTGSEITFNQTPNDGDIIEVIDYTATATTTYSVQAATSSTVTFTTDGTTNQQACDTFTKTSVHSVKYFFQVKSGTDFMSGEIVVVNDESAVSVSTYGIVESDGTLGTFDADISGANCRLLFTPASASSMTLIFKKVESSTASFISDGSTNQQIVTTFTASEVNSVKYFFEVNNSNDYMSGEITLVHDGTNAFISTYGIVESDYTLGSFQADINSGSCRLLFTPAASLAMIVKLVKTEAISTAEAVCCYTDEQAVNQAIPYAIALG